MWWNKKVLHGYGRRSGSSPSLTCFSFGALSNSLNLYSIISNFQKNNNYIKRILRRINKKIHGKHLSLRLTCSKFIINYFIFSVHTTTHSGSCPHYISHNTLQWTLSCVNFFSLSIPLLSVPISSQFSVILNLVGWNFLPEVLLKSCPTLIPLSLLFKNLF